MTDDEIYERINEIGKRLLPTMKNLTDFVNFELNRIEESDKQIQRNGSEEAKNLSKQALKYWVVNSSKVDYINNKVFC